MDDLKLIGYMFAENMRYKWLRFYLKHKLGNKERADALLGARVTAWYNPQPYKDVVTIYNLLHARQWCRDNDGLH